MAKKKGRRRGRQSARRAEGLRQTIAQQGVVRLMSAQMARAEESMRRALDDETIQQLKNSVEKEITKWSNLLLEAFVYMTELEYLLKEDIGDPRDLTLMMVQEKVVALSKNIKELKALQAKKANEIADIEAILPEENFPEELLAFKKTVRIHFVRFVRWTSS
jgi:hypothetical protein